MGTWSGQPFGNDAAADWAWELDGSDGWDAVLEALQAVLDTAPASVDADAATVAIAAAEVVAHQRGRPTQSDSYTESISSFVDRVPAPPAEVASIALRALDVATVPDGELAELWADAGADEWTEANQRIREALSLPPLVASAPAAPRKRTGWGWGKGNRES